MDNPIVATLGSYAYRIDVLDQSGEFLRKECYLLEQQVINRIAQLFPAYQLRIYGRSKVTECPLCEGAGCPECTADSNYP